MDAFQYRTDGGRDNVERLAALDLSLVVSWASRSDVDEKVMCFLRPQLSVDFRLLKRVSLDIGRILYAMSVELSQRQVPQFLPSASPRITSRTRKGWLRMRN